MTTAKHASASLPPADEIYDLLGIGFGPANLALAISLRENQEINEKGFRYAFLEKQPSFGWHTTLLLPGAMLQVSQFKDLATMRDPTSTYTFVNYLHQQGRLAAYINKEGDVPSRREWSAYLTWAAKRMDDVVSYGENVESIEPVPSSALGLDGAEGAERVKLLRITSRIRGRDESIVRYARNISVAVGGVARIPQELRPIYPASPWTEAAPVVHSSTFLPSLAALEATLSARAAERMGRSSPSTSSWPLQFAVVGSGQSSAEMALYLCRTFPSARVAMIFRSSAIVPSDDSAFVNAAAFDPERTDIFWQAGAKERAEWLAEFKRTNYNVVRYDVLNALNQLTYDQRIEFGAPWPGADGPTGGRLDMYPNTTLEGANVVSGTEAAGVPQVELVTRSLKDGASVQPKTGKYDAVFIGTGFERSVRSISFLQPLAPHIPAIDANAEERKAALGFPNEAEDEAGIAAAAPDGDESAIERLRERTRGITRDYRLVPYASDAYAPHGASPSRRSSAATTSSGEASPNSSSTTLNGDEASGASSDGAFEPAIYTLGGNEQSHGLSDSLLSIVAYRAGELTESLLKRAARHRPATPASSAAAATKASAKVDGGAKSVGGLVSAAAKKAQAQAADVSSQLAQKLNLAA